jgi:hypothetical protein
MSARRSVRERLISDELVVVGVEDVLAVLPDVVLDPAEEPVADPVELFAPLASPFTLSAFLPEEGVLLFLPPGEHVESGFRVIVQVIWPGELQSANVSL